MMDGGTGRNMQIFIPKIICVISASSWFYYKKFITMHGHMNAKCQGDQGDYVNITVQKTFLSKNLTERQLIRTKRKQKYDI